MNLRIRVDGTGEDRLVHLAGECDIATAALLQEALWELRPPEVRNLLIDVSEVDFFDSTALGVLVGVHKRLREHDGRLEVTGASGSVARVFEITGLDRVFRQTPEG